MEENKCWDQLGAWGAPLTAIHESESPKDLKDLFGVIKAARGSLEADPGQPDFERKQDALNALCLALKTHYLDYWQQTGLSVDPSGWPDRMIKLYRIAKTRLGMIL